MKRFAIFITAVTLLFSTCLSGVYAADEPAAVPSSKKIMFYLKPDISIELNGIRETFKDANGQTVYPVIYNGTAYLPVRAVSALMKQPIEWDGGSKTIFIGKTLSYPDKTSAPIPTDSAVTAGEEDIIVAGQMEQALVTGYSKPNVLIMYDFVIQTFKDGNGTTIYPLNYNGSTYLPIRSISKLLGGTITWDNSEKKISIITEESSAEIPTKTDAVTALMKDIYDREEALYYEASAKITSIKNATEDEKQAIAVSASDNYLKAQEITAEINNINKKTLSADEKVVCDKLLDFAQSNEYYILVLENIAYLAASDSDYSMLADTFLYFALDAQTKMYAAREAIITE